MEVPVNSEKIKKYRKLLTCKPAIWSPEERQSHLWTRHFWLRVGATKKDGKRFPTLKLSLESQRSWQRSPMKQVAGWQVGRYYSLDSVISTLVSRCPKRVVPAWYIQNPWWKKRYTRGGSCGLGFPRWEPLGWDRLNLKWCIVWSTNFFICVHIEDPV